MIDHIDLFTEMTAAADALTHDNRVPSKVDLQVEFRQIQNVRFPELGTDHWVALFELWHTHYLALIERRRVEAFERLKAFTQAAAKAGPPGAPFVCPCGEVCDPLGDPNFAQTHGQHIYLAQSPDRRPL